MNIEDTIQQFKKKFTRKSPSPEYREMKHEYYLDCTSLEKFIRNALQEQERDIYQNVADNFGYLSQTDGDIRAEAKTLHEHFLGLALKESK